MDLQEGGGAIGEVGGVVPVQYQIGIPAARHHLHPVCMCVW